MDMSQFKKSEIEFIKDTERVENCTFLGCMESDYEFAFRSNDTSKLITKISPKYYYELDFFNDGLGDVGDDDLADSIQREIKETLELKEYLVYDDFNIEIEKCPKCGNWDTWTIFMTNCIWEIWAKCTSHGCGHVWCVVTE